MRSSRITRPDYKKLSISWAWEWKAYAPPFLGWAFNLGMGIEGLCPRRAETLKSESQTSGTLRYTQFYK